MPLLLCQVYDLELPFTSRDLSEDSGFSLEPLLRLAKSVLPTSCKILAPALHQFRHTLASRYARYSNAANSDSLQSRPQAV